MTLSTDGFSLRTAIAEAGIELTPDELEDGLIEAEQRIGHGECNFCGEVAELRYGGCFECVIGNSP